MTRSIKEAKQLQKSLSLATLTTVGAIVLFSFSAIRLVILEESYSGRSTLAACMLLAVALIVLAWQRTRLLTVALTEAQQEALVSATTDYLTGLVNRREFARVLGGVKPGSKALALLDLDNFKAINDVHGHLTGDDILKSVGQILVSAIGDARCCARLGGDEFAVIISSSAAAEPFFRRVDRELRALKAVPQQRVIVTASIGVTPLADIAPEEALRRADIAMYSAKRAGGGRADWFSADQEAELLARIELENDIRRGIAAGEFIPHFQPQIDMLTGELIGFEVLARWQSPTRGLCLPEVFIDVAEDSGLLGELSMSVMGQALSVAKGWPDHLKIALNIAPSQLKDEMLACRIIEQLTRSGFPAARLEIELTESSLLHDQAQASVLIRSLKNVGAQLSLDDFGTGYASLTQLQSLPFDRIKIDKSFVGRILGDEQTETIVRAIASLGQQLHLPVTAEGVESEAVGELLKQMGCESAQGWLYGKAQEADAVAIHYGFERPNGPSAPETPMPVQVERRSTQLRGRRGG